MSIEQKISTYLKLIETEVGKIHLKKSPENLYRPIEYMLSIGGKRIRPATTLLAAEALDGELSKAIPSALGVEFFHNFTLIHDDIMDNAPLRRGKETVYKKWNSNVAILSGDALLVLALEQIAKSENNLSELLKCFNKTALEVCEGQQMDMDFETENEVSIEQYKEMIRLKTAVLLGCSFKMGALSVGADNAIADSFYSFGENLGIAFQLQDDYLDCYGGENFGKQVGGDILSNKKTFLFIKALAKSGDKQKEDFNRVTREINSSKKIEKALSLYSELDIANDTKKEIDFYHQKALDNLNSLPISEDKKQILVDFSAFLMNRKV